MRLVSRSLFLALFFIVLLSGDSFSQKEYVFEDKFDSNEKLWPLPNGGFDQSEISGGVLRWQHQSPEVKTISAYVNRISDQGDFSVEATFTIYKPGSEYGLMWGGINAQDAFFIKVKNLKYQLLESQNGVYQTIRDYENPFKLKLNTNHIKVERAGSQVHYWINGTKIHSHAYSKIKGKSFGFALWNDSKVTIDDFKVRGDALAIPVVENMVYTEAPINLGPKINTSSQELTPVISADEETIYFTRRFAPENIGGAGDLQDIYVSEFQNGQWAQARNIGKPLNNQGPNAVCSVTPDGNQLLLMNTYSATGEPEAMGLSISSRTETGWTLPEKVMMRDFYNRSQFYEFFMSNDGRTILLAIEREDTKGNRDLYVSFKLKDGTWSSPKGLGAVVNTPGIEFSPFLASDGVSLYFSSTGHPGFGKNDIFLTRRLDDTWTNWSKPLNLGKPINSEGRDFYYSVPASGEYAYFTSSTNGIANSVDIFKVKLPEPVKPKPVLLVKGKVLNSKTKKPIAAEILVYDLETGEEVGLARSRPGDGKYEITLPAGKEYAFYADKKGYYAVRENLDLRKFNRFREVTKDLYLTPIEAGQAVSLNNIFFVRSKAVLLPKSFPELDRLADMMSDNNRITIQLEGHTDNTGSAELNVKLSRERAEKVKEYLIKRGIEEPRIATEGYGGSKPIASNDREETRKLNRRVEFRIMNF